MDEQQAHLLADFSRTLEELDTVMESVSEEHIDCSL